MKEKKVKKRKTVRKKKVVEKKEQVRKTAEKDNKKVLKGYDKQTKTIIIIMVVLIASVFLTHFIIQESRKFEYNGLNFYKEKEGSILYYKSLLGLVVLNGENVPFILKLRNDPRVLDDISVNQKISLNKKEAILSLSPEIAECPNTYITLIDFSRTLKAFGIKASAATTDKEYAKEYNATLADCEDAEEKLVVVMKEGNETKITRDDTCYTIEIKNCEIQESFERFLLGLVEK